MWGFSRRRRPDVGGTAGDDHTFTVIGVFDSPPGLRFFQLEMWYAGYTDAPPDVGEHFLQVGQPYLVATTYPFLTLSNQISAAAARKSR